MIKQNLLFYVNLWLYRGIRFRNGLPMRGQSTRSNAKTIKYTINFFNLKKF
jgi:ribosomal protein S13